MNYIKNQRGIAAMLEVGLALLVIGALAFVGYRTYQSRQNSGQTTQPDTPTTEAVPNPEDESQNATIKRGTPCTPQGGYCIIKELNVKFPYDGKPEGLRYLVEKQDNGEPGAVSVLFGSSSLESYADKRGNNDCASAGWLGSLYRSKSKPNPKENDMPANAYFGGYYYTYGPPQNICADAKASNDEMFRQIEALSPLVKQVQPI